MGKKNDAHDPSLFNPKQYKCWIFPAIQSVKIKAGAFTASLLLLFASCSDYNKEPLLRDEIRGEWVRLDDDRRHYIFADDYATTWLYNFGTVTLAQWFEADYAGRDVFLSEKNTGQTQTWRFSEIQGDTLCTVIAVQGQTSATFDLKRVK